jgi:hypothetical protein
MKLRAFIALGLLATVPCSVQCRSTGARLSSDDSRHRLRATGQRQAPASQAGAAASSGAGVANDARAAASPARQVTMASRDPDRQPASPARQATMASRDPDRQPASPASQAATGDRGGGRPHVTCRIISAYRYEGRPTLHLECPTGGVAVGQTGDILRCNGEPVQGSALKVIKVLPPYALVATNVSSIICASWARIFLTLGGGGAGDVRDRGTGGASGRANAPDAKAPPVRSINPADDAIP